MSYSLSKLREAGEEEEREGREENGWEEGEGRAIWQCVPHSGHSFVDIRKLKLRSRA